VWTVSENVLKNDMNLNEILHNELLDLPKSRNGKWFPKYVEETLNQYIELTKDIDCPLCNLTPKEIHDSIKRLCIAIITSVNYYFNGHPYEAYESIANLLGKIDNKEDYCNKILKFHMLDKSQPLYRIRVAEPNESFSRYEMFHVPFELREKHVKTQRYSITGLPCLYLSNSIYVTWVELNKPNLDKIHASLLVPSDRNNCILIDLAHPNALRKEYGENSYHLNLLDYIITWPLVFACSITTEEKNNTFKPEYIIPQILLQYVRRNENIHGIKYFSNSINYNEQNVGEFYNIAIPVVEMKEKGHCNLLKGAFNMSESISIQKIDAALGGQLTLDKANANYNVWVKEIEIIKEKPFPYKYSRFHDIEKHLFLSKAKSIDF